MITFQGTYFDGKSSKAHPVSVICSGGFVLLRDEANDLKIDLKRDDVFLAPPLGNTRRVLDLPGGGGKM